MTAMTARFLEPDMSGRYIQFIVSYQNTTGLYLEEAGNRCQSLTTVIHVVHGFDQHQLAPIDLSTGHLTEEALVVGETGTQLSGQFVYKPEPSVVPGSVVFTAGIAKPGNKIEMDSFARQLVVVAFGSFVGGRRYIRRWRFLVVFWLNFHAWCVNSSHLAVTIVTRLVQINQTHAFRHAQL